jgi:regulator of cell morphogenesis and NO signaling
MTQISGLLEKNAALLPPEALISHIIWRFHDTHRRELPQLINLARQAETANMHHSYGPKSLSPILEVIAAELEEHMAEEEEILFPLMLSGRALRLDPPIKHLKHEHDQHAAILRRLDELANDWELLEDDPQSRALLAGLRRFIDDLRQHLELENTALFPQFSEK